MTQPDSKPDSIVFPDLMPMTQMTQSKPNFGEGKTPADSGESCESSESRGEHDY